MKQTNWSLYMLHYQPDSLYTGITTDVMRRVQQHRAGSGAKCLRGKQNLQLVYCCRVGERGLALKLEYKIKQLSHAKKKWLLQHCTDVTALQEYFKI